MENQTYLTTSLSFEENEYIKFKPIIEKLNNEFWVPVADYIYGGVRTVIFKRQIKSM